MQPRQQLLATIAGALALLGTASAEDLIDIYELSLDNDPQLLAARARFESQREFRRQAVSNFLPQVSASGSLTKGDNQFSVGSFTFPEEDTDTENLRLELRQVIYDHANYQQLDQARLQVAQAEAEYQDALQSFVLRGAQAYFDVLAAEDALSFARAEQRAVGRQLEQAEQRYEVGLTAITDVYEARAQFDITRAQTIVAENQLQDAREALRELTGQWIEDLDLLKAELPVFVPDPADPEEWVAMALESNPALTARRLAMDVASEGVDLARADYFPTLNAVVSYNEFTNNEFILRDDNQVPIGRVPAVAEDTQIQLQLNVPLYQGGRVNSRVRQAVADYEAAQQQYEEQRRATLRQTRNAYRATQASVLEVEAREQALLSAESALEATEAGFEVGTRTIVDVLLSQRQLFQAQRDQARARYDYVLNVLTLKLAAGVLERSDVVGVNDLLVARPPERETSEPGR